MQALARGVDVGQVRAEGDAVQLRQLAGEDAALQSGVKRGDARLFAVLLVKDLRDAVAQGRFGAVRPGAVVGVQLCLPAQRPPPAARDARPTAFFWELMLERIMKLAREARFIGGEPTPRLSEVCTKTRHVHAHLHHAVRRAEQQRDGTLRAGGVQWRKPVVGSR